MSILKFCTSVQPMGYSLIFKYMHYSGRICIPSLLQGKSHYTISIFSCTGTQCTHSLRLRLRRFLRIEIEMFFTIVLNIFFSCVFRAKLAGETATSHPDPVTCCKYNSMNDMGHVITASQSSVSFHTIRIYIPKLIEK